MTTILIILDLMFVSFVNVFSVQGSCRIGDHLFRHWKVASKMQANFIISQSPFVLCVKIYKGLKNVHFFR